MKIYDITTPGIILAFTLVFGLTSCSKNTIVIDNGGGSESGTPGAPALVTFHASVEGRNMTKAMSPIRQNVQVEMYSFYGTSKASGTPAAQGTYISQRAGLLSGVDGYKMQLGQGVYNFYSVSTNTTDIPPSFTKGVSERLFNGIDYLWWHGPELDVASAQVGIPVVYGHSATQVAIELEAGPGIKLNQLISAQISASAIGAQMDLATGIIPATTTYDSQTNLDKMGINGFLAQYIMLPLKTTVPMKAAFSLFINDENSPRNYTVEIPVPDGELKAGDSYRFAAVIDGDGVSFSSVNVTNWVDVDETGKPLYPTQK